MAMMPEGVRRKTWRTATSSASAETWLVPCVSIITDTGSATPMA
jgi:hypothetical protein